MKHNFFDDYSEGAHPAILDFIREHNDEQQTGYGNDQYCQLAADRIRKNFGLPDADVHFLPAGTICNVVGLSSMLRPYESIIASDKAHIFTNESGGIEATGHKILEVTSDNGKVTVEGAKAQYEFLLGEHTTVPRVLALTQVTERGALYTKQELETLIAFAKDQELYTYVDGARLGVALAHQAGMSPEEFGRLGIDMFYIGGTKNGGLYGEAMVITNDELKPNFRNHMKQRGALMAKGRFLGQQFARFFGDDNLWLELARHANAMGQKLHEGLQTAGIELDDREITNLVFPTIENQLVERLSQKFGFYPMLPPSDGKTQIRLVTSWATPESAVDEFIAQLS